MARIIVEATHPADGPPQVTLSERVVAAHLDDGHYVMQLIERLGWAAHDAEAIETQTGRDDTEDNWLQLPAGATRLQTLR